MKFKLVYIFILFSTFSFGQLKKLYKFGPQNGKYGFIDKTGKIRIEPKFLNVQDFSEGLAFVSQKTSKRGFNWICIDTLGNEIFNIGDDFVEKKFNEGFSVVSNLDEDWFINTKGEKLFNKTWKTIAGNFQNGIAMVSDFKHGSKYYYINAKGQKLTKFQKGSKTIYIEGYTINFDKTYTIIDSLGNTIFEGFDSFGGFNDELIKIEKNGKWGYIDNKGNIIIDFLYEEDRRMEFDKYLKINIDSLDALPKASLRNLGNFNDGLVSFQKDSLWGFLNKSNEIVIQPKFKEVKDFSEGVAGVSLDGIKWGFIDKKSNFLIEPKFYLVRKFEEGICAVRQCRPLFGIRGREFYYDAIINLKGEIVNQLTLYCYQGLDRNLIEYYEGFHFTGGVHYLDQKGQKLEPRK